MTTYTLETKKKFEITARSIAIAFGVAFLVLFFWNMLNYQDPKPAESGIFVIINNNDSSQEEIAPLSQEKEKEMPVKQEEIKKEPVKTQKVIVKKEVIKDDHSKTISIAEKDLDQKENKETTDNKFEEDATKQTEADDLKNGIKDALASGNDNSETPNNKDENPDSGKLKDLSNGSGLIGGGLANRAGSGPKVNDRSQETGVVVIKVCVDNKGSVISAKFTQFGSTSTNIELKKIAEKNAKKWKFKEGGIDKQCGTITYDFKVK